MKFHKHRLRVILTFAVLSLISFKVSIAIEFNCTFATVPDDYVGSVYQCEATVDARNDERLTAVYGKHNITEDDPNLYVVILKINYQDMIFFPVNMESLSFFPNLKVINFYGNSISQIKNAHLAPFKKNLIYLNLYGSKITVLDDNLFDGLDLIQYVNFGANHIAHVGHDIVLPKVGSVFFNANPCINMRASTPENIAVLRFNLLINCTLIAPIEAALKSRQNLLFDKNDQVRSVANVISSLEERLLQMDRTIQELKTSVRYLVDRNTELERREVHKEERKEAIQYRNT